MDTMRKWFNKEKGPSFEENFDRAWCEAKEQQNLYKAYKASRGYEKVDEITQSNHKSELLHSGLSAAFAGARVKDSAKVHITSLASFVEDMLQPVLERARADGLDITLHRGEYKKIIGGRSSYLQGMLLELVAGKDKAHDSMEPSLLSIKLFDHNGEMKVVVEYNYPKNGRLEGAREMSIDALAGRDIDDMGIVVGGYYDEYDDWGPTHCLIVDEDRYIQNFSFGYQGEDDSMCAGLRNPNRISLCAFLKPALSCWLGDVAISNNKGEEAACGLARFVAGSLEATKVKIKGHGRVETELLDQEYPSHHARWRNLERSSDRRYSFYKRNSSTRAPDYYNSAGKSSWTPIPPL
jgi:hypothetical protein